MNIGLGEDSELSSLANMPDGKRIKLQNNQGTGLASHSKLIIPMPNFGMHGQIGMPGIYGHTKRKNGPTLKILVFRGLIRKL